MFETGVILAAGRGVRMLPLTTLTPKPLLPDLESCLLRHQIEFVRDHVKNLFVTVGYKSELVGSAARRFGADEVIDIGQGGNASWISSSYLGKLNSPTLVITCDNVMQINLEELSDEVASDSQNSIIVTIEKDDSYPGDRIAASNGKIVEMGRNVTSQRLASGLQAIIPSAVLELRKEVEDFSEVWSCLIAQNKLNLSQIQPSSWVALDTPEQLGMWVATRSDSLE